MNLLSDVLCLVDSFWTSALNHLWQTTWFGCFVGALLIVLRRAPARIRYGLCLIASAKFLLVPNLLKPAARVLGLNLEAIFFDLIWLANDPKLLILHRQKLFPVPENSLTLVPMAALTLWGVGSILVFRGWFRRQRLFAKLVAGGREIPRLNATVRRLSARAGIRGKIRLYVSEDFTQPGVWGAFRPVILLPANTLKSLSSRELNAVLLHELSHVRRRDNLVGNLHMALCAIFWFHPLVWWFDRQMLAEREIICDAIAVELSGATDPYRSGLMKVLHQGTGLSLAGVSCAGGGDLGKRILRLATIRVGRSSRAEFLHLLAPLLAILILLALTLAVTPLLPCEGGIFLSYTVAKNSK